MRSPQSAWNLGLGFSPSVGSWNWLDRATSRTTRPGKNGHSGRVPPGGNFHSAPPDTRYNAEALRCCGLTAHVSIKLNRDQLVTAGRALILPCLGRTERDYQSSGVEAGLEP